ncbi:MAG: hypothetical protein K6F95_02975 [Selenomonas sp.]|uniref:hypothetical protein n=1 Tax=Selenomonas sp. TaxID=2053611 RepID=UPI0025F17CF2|nr:hypothetical protein [Selenomonas sp.]MCR5756852.1 hypothetical protein [Selenomonas sp.]
MMSIWRKIKELWKSEENKAMNMEKIYQQVWEKLVEADFIVVGGASGMSAAGGPNWYVNDENYRKYFGKLEEKYGSGSIWGLLYRGWENQQNKWGYLATLIHWVRNQEVFQPYKDLHELLRDKDYEIITTNQDQQFVKEFKEKDVAIIQGDWGYSHCLNRCCDEVYDNREVVETIFANLENGTDVPADLVPKCPHCGGDMRPWVRGFEFLEGAFYHEQYKKYEEAIRKAESDNRKVVYLELGVGMMTPMFIKEPFMNFTYRNPNATYITMNPKHAYVPDELGHRGIAVKEDIAVILKHLLYLKKEKEQVA